MQAFGKVLGTHQELIVSASFQPQEPLLVSQVRDHGIGIESAHLALIFHRFYRVDTELTRETNGLGLGLALCREIVARHGRMLWSDQVRRIGYLHVPPTSQNTNAQGEALHELLDLLGDGDMLLMYQLDLGTRDEHNLATLQQQLGTMDVTLVTASETDAEGASYVW